MKSGPHLPMPYNSKSGARNMAFVIIRMETLEGRIE
jgi:hypothetical protein